MKELSKINISSFTNIKSPDSETIGLFEEFGNIKRGKYKELISKCRQAISDGDKNLYSSLKIQLPAVTFCGEFSSGRKASDIDHYNNLMIFDIDNLNRLSLSKTLSTLKDDKFVLALWLSPSGLGLKGLVIVDSDKDKHSYTFNALRIYFADKYKIDLDRSGSDVSRLCFSSWDENFFYNKNSQTFTDFFELESSKVLKVSKRQDENKEFLLNKNALATEGLNKTSDSKVIRNIIKFLIKNDISITESYDLWVKIALGISYTFSYDVGERFFLQICAQDKEKHDENQSIRLLKYCYNKRQLGVSNAISFATIIYFAQQKGFIIKKKF